MGKCPHIPSHFPVSCPKFPFYHFSIFSRPFSVPNPGAIHVASRVAIKTLSKCIAPTCLCEPKWKHVQYSTSTVEESRDRSHFYSSMGPASEYLYIINTREYYASSSVPSCKYSWLFIFTFACLSGLAFSEAGRLQNQEHPAFFRCWRHSKGIRDRLRHRETKVR